MRASLLAVVVVAALACALPAQAHHGVAAVSVAGPEGPGAAMETTSALGLPQRTAFAMVKSEYASFKHYDFAAPQNKDYALFNMLALGYGLRPWLSAYLFQPFSVKTQDETGTNAGFGDTNLMLTMSFKYDDGLKLIPEKESLDELRDWHFAVWASTTLPLGPTEHHNRQAEPYSPDMQTGFGAPSSCLGVAVLKQLNDDFSWLADINYQYFFSHDYSYTRYQFGGETRLNTALTYRLFGKGHFRLDVVPELSGLYLQRDQERNEQGHMESLLASGGAILYASGGLRAYLGPFSAALAAKKAVWRNLNEQAQQQGSEGLENLRVAFTLSYSTRF